MTLDNQEHRVPADAKVVEPTICENCSRRLYVEVGKTKRRVCISCSVVHDVGAQVWVCLTWRCGAARKYGDGQPEETSGKRLRCGKCGDVTRHEFFEVSRGTR